jgi:hypothetical protein
MRFVRGFGRFWYDFIVGDDWRIAAAVAIVLAAGALTASATSHGATWLPPLAAAAVMLAFTLTLVAGVRR